MKSITCKRSVAASVMFGILMVSCILPRTKNTVNMNNEKHAYLKGTYGYDVSFFDENNIQTVELKDTTTGAFVLLIPDYQGRVMTSSANGGEGQSFGWINYDLIRSGQVKKQFNPYGGEERFWLGPEGGPFSVYFSKGEEQVYNNWLVPPVLDKERFDVEKYDHQRVTFVKNAILQNASGMEFEVGIKRTVSLLSREELLSLFNTSFSDELNIVAYQSENTLTNNGEVAWERKRGLLSIWLLGMFNPSPSTTVFIPYHEEGEGIIVNDDYFGKVPSDRLIVDHGIVYFKIDGKLRSKIGLPPERAKGLCGSYDSQKGILTILSCSVPSEPMEYVNSKWGEQDDPYQGDEINAYNDGPVADGSVMGPFYEIETSSPAAALKPHESITHIQRVIHMKGTKKDLARVVLNVFGLDLDSIDSKFQ